MADSVKTAISIQKDIFQEVNELASELHLSRSRIFVLAAQDFIKKYQNQRLLAKINHAYNDVDDFEEQIFRDEMKKKQIKNLEREPW